MRIEEIKLSDETYNEIKEISIKLWKTKDNKFGYVDEKVNQIKDLPNSSSNVARIIKMFDHWHQELISQHISYDSKLIISQCIKAGWIPQRIGVDLELNPFFKV